MNKKYVDEFGEIHKQIQFSFWIGILLCAWLGSIFAVSTAVTYYCVAVILLCLISYPFRQMGFVAATVVFMAGLWLLTAFMLLNHPHMLFVGILAVQIPVVSHLTNNRIGAVVALGSSLSIAMGTPEDTVTYITLIWMLWGVGFILSRGLVDAIEISLNYQRYMLIQMDEARSSRAQLAFLSKSLSEAQERLQHMNSQLRHARDVAEDARRVKALFAANVSHELRTPINLIVGFSEVMAMTPEAYGVPLPSAYRPDVRAIYRNAKHLQSLINDILDISQIEAEHLAIIREYSDLSSVLQETADIARGMIEEKGLNLVVNLPPELPHIWIDQTRIRQVVLNLLGNAVRFTDRGNITMSAAVLEDAAVQIDIRDTGIGITPQNIDRVFDEFYQVPDRHGQRGGAGLGLTLSRKLVQQHGGRMWAQSLGIPEQGSTFSFTLPLTNHLPAIALHNTTKPGQSPAYRKVMIADPDPAVRHLFRGYFRNSEVVEAHHPESALPLISALRPNAVIAHFRSLTPQGIEAIQVASPETSIIECDLPSGRRAMQTLGIHEYLVKPISREGILAAIENLNCAVSSILIIDDEPDVVRMFRRMLQATLPICTIRQAYGGHDGLYQMRAQRPDVVILDILMPDIDGFSVIEVMQSDSNLSRIPIIVVSAKGAAEAIVPRLSGEIRIARACGFEPIELVNSLDAFVSQLKPYFDQEGTRKPVD